MKNFFTNISLISLTILSFYYTSFITNLLEKTKLVNNYVDYKKIIIDLNYKDPLEIYKIFKNKNVLTSFAVEDKHLNNKELENLLIEGNKIYYKGNTEKGLKKYIQMMNYYGNTPLCITITKDNKELCNKNNIEIIEYKNYITKNALINVKESLNNETYLVIKDTKENIKELSIIINFIINKGYIIK